MDISTRDSFHPRCSLSRSHLLIVGRDLDQLIDLSIALRGLSQITTLAITDDPADRAAWAAPKGYSQVILCLGERDRVIEMRQLVEISPPALLLVPERISQLHSELKQAGCLVLTSFERTTVIAATLIAYAESRFQFQR